MKRDVKFILIPLALFIAVGVMLAVYHSGMLGAPGSGTATQSTEVVEIDKDLADRGVDSPYQASMDERDPVEAGSNLFAELSHIDVPWRDASVPDQPSTPFGPKIEEYRLKAMNGDAEAAFVLYTMLNACKSAFVSETSMRASVDQFRQTFEIQLPGWDAPKRLNNTESAEQLIEHVENTYSNCYPITEAQKSEADMWLKKAYLKGLPIAQGWYASLAPDSTEALSAGMNAWSSGNAQGLLAMRDALLRDYEVGRNPQGLVRAHAAFYAYAFLLTETSQSQSRKKLVRTLEELEKAQSKLVNYQISEAKELAREMIESNTNCCYRF